MVINWLSIVPLLMQYGPKVKTWIDIGLPIFNTLRQEGVPASQKIITVLQQVGGELFPALKDPIKEVAAAADALFNPHGTMWIQTSLNTLIKSGLDVDGDYGPATKAAVTNFQTANQPAAGPIDGWAGRKTQAVLVSELAKIAPK